RGASPPGVRGSIRHRDRRHPPRRTVEGPDPDAAGCHRAEGGRHDPPPLNPRNPPAPLTRRVRQGDPLMVTSVLVCSAVYAAIALDAVARRLAGRRPTAR